MDFIPQTLIRADCVANTGKTFQHGCMAHSASPCTSLCIEHRRSHLVHPIDPRWR